MVEAELHWLHITVGPCNVENDVQDKQPAKVAATDIHFLLPAVESEHLYYAFQLCFNIFFMYNFKLNKYKKYEPGSAEQSA